MHTTSHPSHNHKVMGSDISYGIYAGSHGIPGRFSRELSNDLQIIPVSASGILFSPLNQLPQEGRQSWTKSAVSLEVQGKELTIFRSPPIQKFEDQMTLLAKLKAVNAPKTEDTQYEDARAFFKASNLDVKSYGNTAHSLGRSISDLSRSFLKFTTDAKNWMDEGAPEDLRAKTIASQETAARMDELANSLIVPQIDPSFVSPLLNFQASLAALRRLKKARMAAVKEYDKSREYLRLLEASKKSKKADIDKARAKAEDLRGKYAAANSEFIREVETFKAACPAKIGDPFKTLITIFCQYVRRINPVENEYIPPPGGDFSDDIDADLFMSFAPRASSAVQIAFEPSVEITYEDESFFVWNREADPGSEFGDLLEEDGDGWGGVFRPVSVQLGDIQIQTEYPDNPFSR